MAILYYSVAFLLNIIFNLGLLNNLQNSLLYILLKDKLLPLRTNMHFYGVWVTFTSDAFWTSRTSLRLISLNNAYLNYVSFKRRQHFTNRHSVSTNASVVCMDIIIASSVQNWQSSVRHLRVNKTSYFQSYKQNMY